MLLARASLVLSWRLGMMAESLRSSIRSVPCLRLPTKSTPTLSFEAHFLIGPFFLSLTKWGALQVLGLGTANKGLRRSNMNEALCSILCDENQWYFDDYTLEFIKFKKDGTGEVCTDQKPLH